MPDRKLAKLARQALGRRAAAHVHRVSEGSDVDPKTGQGFHAEAEAGFNEISIWYGDARVARLALEAALKVVAEERAKAKERKTDANVESEAHRE